MRTHAGPSVILSAVVIRACWVCRHPRVMGQPCASCGCTDLPDVTDLGVIASHQKSRWARLKWNAWGCYAAQRRIRKTNKEMLRKA